MKLEHTTESLTHHQLWDLCLDYFRSNTTPEQFGMTFKFVSLNSFENDKLVLNVPSSFIVEVLEKNYMQLMNSAFTRYFSRNVSLFYNVEVVSGNKNGASVMEGSDNEPRLLNGKPREDARKSPDDVTAPQVQDLDSQLRPSYNFANLIEGQSNKLVRSVGEAIAVTPAQTFNPFFVFGHSGVGKTHLVNAIGLKIKELHPEMRVLYVSAHLFTVQYTDAVRNNKVNDFIRFYQTIDTLIIDDIQELSGKRKTQDTFFHIFNHLQVNKKQIILTADRPPKEIEGFEERLLTRFKWGLQAEMEKPTKEMRYDILQAKINNEGLQIPSHIVRYIAEHVDKSVRDLEGVLNSLIARSICFNCEIDMELVEKVLTGFVTINVDPVTVEDVKNVVCQHFNIKTAVLDSPTRKQEIAYARQIAMYLSVEMTDASNVQIGRLIGNRNHATVNHACKQIKNLIDVNEKASGDIDAIRELIRSHKG